jgi:hypothetical protein
MLFKQSYLTFLDQFQLSFLKIHHDLFEKNETFASNQFRKEWQKIKTYEVKRNIQKLLRFEQITAP